MQKGKIIVIEGGDSSGKATQTALLHDRLAAEGHMVEKMAFPRYQEDQVGGLIRECLDGKHGDFISTDPRIASLFYAVDRRESLPQIQEWLDEGKVIIFDRYTTANMLHQGAKQTDTVARGELLTWIHRLEHEILNLPVPDLVIYLNIPAKGRIALLKNAGRTLDLAEKNEAHQIQVDEAAADMLQMYPRSTSIDCMKEGELKKREEIAEAVYQEVHAIIGL